MTGFLCLYKRAGVTSFGALAEIRRLTGVKKIGHCGTLDPMATGVLPAAFGRASKFIEFLPDNRKAYTAEFRLGTETDTLDITGTVLRETEPTVGENEVKACLGGFVGEQLQVPPMYSAVSKNGVRLYELARKGITAEREARKIVIYSIDYLGCVGKDTYKIGVKCGKGTYIRSLISDIGALLGCGAVMTALERSESNGFSIESALSADVVAESVKNGTFESELIPVEKVLSVYPSITVTERQCFRLKNGVGIDKNLFDGVAPSEIYRIFADGGRFIGVGAFDAGKLKMRKLYEINE